MIVHAQEYVQPQDLCDDVTKVDQLNSHVAAKQIVAIEESAAVSCLTWHHGLPANTSCMLSLQIFNTIILDAMT